MRNRRRDLILWYVKEINVYLRDEYLQQHSTENDQQRYANEFWRDLIDRVC